MSARTFKLTRPHQTGKDIAGWQRSVNTQLARWDADDLLVVDGDYGVTTRAFTSKVLYGLGIPQDLMVKGVTPELRVKVRNRRLTPWERARYVKRAPWRRALSRPRVAKPVNTIIADTWGYHPGVHDGIDVICGQDVPIFAMVKSRVIRISDDWWGLGNPGGALGDRGDGVIILENLVSVGPFVKGQRVVYGHAEKPIVKAGDVVQAGGQIGRAGFANAFHIHLCLNDGSTDRGIGNRDPRGILDYAKKNG